MGAKDGSAAKWKVADGYFQVLPGTGDIFTRQPFGDMQLHVEFAEPSPLWVKIRIAATAV